MEDIFLDHSKNFIKILIVTPIMYALVIFYTRVLGKRSTSQMNSFDWIVTVAMGSLISSTIILRSVSLIEGVLSILLLLMLQYALTKLTVLYNPLSKIFHSSPTLLVYDGEFLEDNMKKERIVKDEIISAIRHSGHTTIDHVHAVVLETNATLSVIKKEDDCDVPGCLEDVSGLPDEIQSEFK